MPSTQSGFFTASAEDAQSPGLLGQGGGQGADASASGAWGGGGACGRGGGGGGASLRASPTYHCSGGLLTKVPMLGGRGMRLDRLRSMSMASRCERCQAIQP